LCNKQIKYFIKFHFPFIFSLLWTPSIYGLS
jgi:hypothetical protein